MRSSWRGSYVSATPAEVRADTVLRSAAAEAAGGDSVAALCVVTADEADLASPAGAATPIVVEAISAVESASQMIIIITVQGT